MNPTAVTPRTLRPQYDQLSNVPGTPPSQTVSSLGSQESRRESVESVLQFERDRYTATGVACEAMLKGLFPSAPPSPSEATAETLLLDLEQALPMRPEPAQYAPIANLCNDILAEHYRSNHPTEDRPARWFVPLGQAILDSEFAQSKPDVVVVIRSSWEEHVRSQLEEVPITQRRESKEWTRVFPDWSTVSSRVQHILNNPSSLKADDLDPQLLCALAIHPPWECIVAIMEFKVSNTPEVQLLSYFCEVMSAGRYRGWTSGAIISGMNFRLVTCDREGAIKSAPTSLRTADGVDTFARWVLAVGSGTLAEAGFSNIFGQTDGQIEGVVFSVPGNAKRASESSIQLKFGKQHYQQYGAFGRGTTLYRVDVTMGNKNISGVCKISWPVATRDSEYDLIQQAREIDPVHLPEILCAWDDTEGALPSRTLRASCPQAALEYKPRILRILVFPFYGPIHELEGDEFLSAFWDIMICNVKLYEANSVHHRDSSVNNMMYDRDKDGHVVGILSDFDLAVSMTRSAKPSSTHRSGTAPFMARDLLDLKPCEQTLEHDFEATLYILLWVALGYKGGKPPPTGDHLSSWRHGTWAQIGNAKRGFINTNPAAVLNFIAPELRASLIKKNPLLQEFAGEKFASGPTTMTAQKFFRIIGPPPPGREPYSPIKTSETGSQA